MILSNAALKNRTTVMVLVLFVVISGVTSYITLPRESTPDIKIPYVMITTANPGASPEDIENNITKEIENEIAALKGKKEITSTSQEGLSIIRVEFHPDVDIDDALQRTKNKVDLAKPNLPQDTDEPIDPVVTEISFSDLPIITVNISGDISPQRMKDIAEKLEDEIEAVPGVLDVDVLGALEREIVLEINPDKVSQYGLTIAELLTFVPAENVTKTAGGLETEGMKLSVRVPGEFTKPTEITYLPIAVRNGKTIYLTDVADVKDTFKDRESYSSLDGQESVSLAIKKRVGANIVDIAKHVNAILEVAKEKVPQGVTFTITTDRSKEIALMIHDLENNIATSFLLVVCVLLITMGFRSSLIVATAIPLSMLMSFAILSVMGLTLNMVVLFSLILALGMLVDNAIVIVENIYRFMEMGYTRLEAAKRGTAEVAWPVIASTATTIAAFGPMLFWPGIMGEFMGYLPMTVIIVLSSSLLVALIVSPVVCSIIGKPTRDRTKEKHESPLIKRYRSLLNTSLTHPVATLGISICILVGVLSIYSKSGLGIEFFPETDPDEGIVNIKLPQGSNIKETRRLAHLAADVVEKHRKSSDGQTAHIDNILINVGSGGSSSDSMQTITGSHLAQITACFPDYEIRPKPSADIIAEMRDEILAIPGAEMRVEKRKEGPPTGEPVTIRIIGEDMKILENIAEQVSGRIADTPNLVNLRSDLEAAKPELVFITDREKAALLGTNTDTIATYLKTVVYGMKVGEYQQFDEDYDIRIRPDVSMRKGIDNLRKLKIPTMHGSVPLTSLGRFEYRPGLGTIHRIDRKRVVTVTGGAQGRPGPQVLQDAQKRLEGLELPEGYQLEYAGEKEEQEKATAFLSKAFLMALLLIVAILVAQFNTLAVPLIILSTVILSLIGVFIGLLVYQQPFGVIMTGVGVISLAGVVVNNAIVLLDFTRQLQKRGYELKEAAVEAGVTRLRPVLLTATTTILGLVPMVTGVSLDFHTFSLATRSSSSQWWQSMAVAVIFGLGFATVLTLVVVPALYVLTSRIAMKMFNINNAPEVIKKQQPDYEDF